MSSTYEFKCKNRNGNKCNLKIAEDAKFNCYRCCGDCKHALHRECPEMCKVSDIYFEKNYGEQYVCDYDTCRFRYKSPSQRK